MKNHKKAISFDLDGTLVKAIYGEMVWNHGIPDEYSKKHSITLDEAKEFIINEYRSIGDVNILWYDITYWLHRFELSVSADELLARYEGYIDTIDNTIEVLEQLKDRFTLIVASNAARIFVEKELDYTGLSPFFSHIVSATTDYNLVKKGEDFYKRLCDEIGLKSHELIHIGDHPVFDFKAPLSLGIDAYLFKNNHSVFNDYRIDSADNRVIYSLQEVLNLI